MIREFTIYCDGESGKVPFSVSLGVPKKGNHPMKSQSHYIQNTAYAQIPADVMDSVSSLYDMGQENNIPGPDLCVYALGAAGELQALEESENLEEQAADDNAGQESDEIEEDSLEEYVDEIG